jgi:hypothetical protein
MEIAFENKWCKIVYKGTLIVLQSKNGKYNDQYFTTLEQAKTYIGVK